METWRRRRVLGAGLAALGALALPEAPASAAAGRAPADPAGPRILARFAGRSRILVVCADGSDDPAARSQIAEAAADPAGLRDRDLLIVEALGPRARAGEQDLGPSRGLRGQLGLPAAGFAVALVGKDGGVKLRARRPATRLGLYRLIDAMPMRRDERARRPPSP